MLTTRRSVKTIADKAFLLSDRVQLSSAEARVKGIKGGSVGVFELIQQDRTLAHTEPKLAFMRLMVSRS